jgi:alkanesulfonate monooxygenase SsuD/methylene tetrahydromethanopterin reductase-like flavin-dependent oxidoreductase (luciferase family)
MFINVFAMPEVPGTLEERKQLRPIGKRTDRYQMMLDELRHIVKLCDQTGVHSFSMTEHHFHTEGGEACPNQVPMFADFAARTERLNFAPMSTVITTRDPLRVAEDWALLDQLSKGRVAGICVARGYQKRWVQILGQKNAIAAATSDQSLSDDFNREVFDEYLEVIFKAWNNDVFDHDGKHYQVPFPYGKGIEGWAAVEWTRANGAEGEIDEQGIIRKIGIVPACYNRKHPPIWVPMNLSPKSMQEAARRGFMPWIFPPDKNDMIKLVDDYQRITAENGFHFGRGENMGAVRAITIGKTREEAFDLAVATTGHVWDDYFGGFGMYEAFRLPSDAKDRPVRFNSKAEATQRMIDTGYQLCGTLDDVKRQMEDLHTVYGTGGNLTGLSWNFFYQGLSPLSVQEQQLEYMSKLIPMFK